MGILQARILEWVAMPSSKGSSLPWDRARVSCIAGKFFTAEPPGKSRCLFSFIKKLPELSKPIVPFYSPINPRSASSPKVVLVSHFNSSHPNGCAVVYHAVLAYFSLTTNDVERLFSYHYWPFINLSLWNVCANLGLCLLNCLSFRYWVAGVIYILWTFVLCQMHVLQTFPLICDFWPVCSLSSAFWWAEVLKFYGIWFNHVFFYGYYFPQFCLGYPGYPRVT